MQGRLPPHNLEAEVATLGAILLDAPAVTRVVDYVRPGDFYRQAHGRIFESILHLWDRGESIDLITLTNELQTAGHLDRVGGAAYISSLTTAVPTSANVELRRGSQNPRCMPRCGLPRKSNRNSIVANDDNYALAA
jgi:replicative DNA helicase